MGWNLEVGEKNSFLINLKCCTKMNQCSKILVNRAYSLTTAECRRSNHTQRFRYSCEQTIVVQPCKFDRLWRCLTERVRTVLVQYGVCRDSWLFWSAMYRAPSLPGWPYWLGLNRRHYWTITTASHGLAKSWETRKSVVIFTWMGMQSTYWWGLIGAHEWGSGRNSLQTHCQTHHVNQCSYVSENISHRDKV